MHQNVLDLGCGDGRVARMLVRDGYAKRVVAIDNDPDAIMQAREATADSRISYLMGSFYTIPTTEQFDLVIMVNSAHFAHRNVPGLVRELYRVCRRGAVLIREPGWKSDYKCLTNTELVEKMSQITRVRNAILSHELVNENSILYLKNIEGCMCYWFRFV